MTVLSDVAGDVGGDPAVVDQCGTPMLVVVVCAAQDPGSASRRAASEGSVRLAVACQRWGTGRSGVVVGRGQRCRLG